MKNFIIRYFKKIKQAILDIKQFIPNRVKINRIFKIAVLIICFALTYFFYPQHFQSIVTFFILVLIIGIYLKIILVNRIWLRVITLVASALIGFFLAKYSPSYILDFFNSKSDRLEVSITMALLGLPVLFCLWLFKTHDTKESIDRSSFISAIQLLTAKDNTHTQSIGLKQLLYLKNVKKVFQKEIDLAIQYVIIYDAESNQGAELKGADLQGIDLRGAQLRKANLQVAKLQGADLQGANLQEAKLQGANLQVAKLQVTDLQGANLQGAYLQGANLYIANLQGTDLKGAKLQGAELRGAEYNVETKFPEGFNPEKHGMIEAD